MKKYFIEENGKANGPFSFEDLKNQPLKKSSLIWFEGLKEWTILENIPELQGVIGTIKPPPIPKRKNKSNRLLIILLFFIPLLAFSFWSYYKLYPKWKNQKTFNMELENFKKTDSINFEVFNTLLLDGVLEANYILGLYNERIGDTLVAIEFFEKSLSTNKKIPAIYSMMKLNHSDSLRYKKLIVEVLPNWLKYINEEDWLSQIEAGKIYSEGLVVKKDNNLAKNYFLKAVSNGSTLGMVFLGNLFRKGNTDSKQKANKLYQKAYQMGNYNGMSAIGIEHYENSNFEDAKKWFLNSSEKKNIQGEYWLGVYYAQGKFEEENLDSALFWLNVASTNQSDRSYFNMEIKNHSNRLISEINSLKEEREAEALRIAEELEEEKRNKASRATSSRRTQKSTNDDEINKYVSCYYCGRGFYQMDGFVKGLSLNCASSYSKRLSDIKIAYNAGYPESQLSYLFRIYQGGEWYCTRKCVYDSRNCLD
jgi:hypothetical protein